MKNVEGSTSPPPSDTALHMIIFTHRLIFKKTPGLWFGPVHHSLLSYLDNISVKSANQYGSHKGTLADIS